jgi:hypothetical protein
MKYGEADLLVSRLIEALKQAHMTKYPEDSERWATNYALGYISSTLASIMCQSKDAAEAVTDRMLTSERYLQSLK